MTLFADTRFLPSVGRTPLLSFVLASIVGEVATFALLLDFGMFIAVTGMPFGGALVGLCASRAALHRT